MNAECGIRSIHHLRSGAKQFLLWIVGRHPVTGKAELPFGVAAHRIMKTLFDGKGGSSCFV